MSVELKVGSTKRYSLEELLHQPPLTKPLSHDEIDQITLESYDQQVKNSLDDLDD